MTKTHRWFAAFFAFGTAMCCLTIFLLVVPGTPLDSLWRVNPEAHSAFHSLGNWSILLMMIVGAACGFAAIGLWFGARWAVPLAILILLINVGGDVFNILIRHDYRAMVGLPIAGAMIVYLIRSSSVAENRNANDE